MCDIMLTKCKIFLVVASMVVVYKSPIEHVKVKLKVIFQVHITCISQCGNILVIQAKPKQREDHTFWPWFVTVFKGI